MSNVYELLDIIESQAMVILKQDELIARLVNENLEKENYIEELSKDLLNT